MKNNTRFFIGMLAALTVWASAENNHFKKLHHIYTSQSKTLDSDQLYSIEVQLANSLLVQAQKMQEKTSLNHAQKTIKNKKIQQSLSFYKNALARVQDPEEKTKILFRIGFLYEMIGSADQAVESYRKILSMSKNPHRLENAKQLIQLIQNPDSHLEDFLNRARQASHAKYHADAVPLYQRYIFFKTNQVRSKITDETIRQTEFQKIEDVFKEYLQAVAYLKDPHFQAQSYDFYLEHSVLRTFVFEARYLKNTALFNLGKFKESAPVFRQVALTQNSSLSPQSAVFALKALMKMNQHLTAHKWAKEFSRLFPKHQSDFQKIVKSAPLPQTAASWL